MAFQTVFERSELKYMLSTEQMQRVLEAMSPHMEPDSYGRTTVRNVYFDTENYRLIRRSMEKPVYKEKLRIRSYTQANADSTVFVELKKKYDGIVYKRRLALSEAEAVAWVCKEGTAPVNTQISREIDYFVDCYGKLRPTVFLSYEREAYYDKCKRDFRITFDDKILCRLTDVSLCMPIYGREILQNGMVLMEVKCTGGLPLWLTRTLSRERIYKTSFSKYAQAYKSLIWPQSGFSALSNNREDICNGHNF